MGRREPTARPNTAELRAALPTALAEAADAYERHLLLEANRSPHTVRAYVSPLAPFIWLGALVMALGGALSLWGRLRVRVGAPSPAAQPAE